MTGDDHVVVTGGAGFIGSHLVRRLLDGGARVTVLDDLSTGRRTNLAALADEPRLTVVEHDVCLAPPPGLDADRVFHLACPASPVHYQLDPVKTVRTCVHGSDRMLDLARRTGARILLTSTSEVYGDPDVHPQDETYWGNVNPVGPRSCYDEGKRCAEALFRSYHSQYAVDVRIARIFNTYGPCMQPDDGRVISNFVMAALRGQPLIVMGDGSQTRSFCYVDDLVAGLLVLMDADDLTDPVNLGNPGEFSMLELAELVVGLTGSRSEIGFGPLPRDDPRRRRPDVGRAEQLLGWTPSTDLEQGLLATIDYFRGAA